MSQETIAQSNDQIKTSLVVLSAVNFEVTKEDLTYRFYMPAGSPLGAAWDACFEVLQRVGYLKQKAEDEAAKELSTHKDEVQAEMPS